MKLFIQIILSFLILSNPLYAKEKKIVFTSILPHSYFIEQMAGEFVDVEVMIKPGHAPVLYDPAPSQMKKLNKAHLYLRVGVPFENQWIDRIKKLNPNIKIVDLRDGIILREIKGHSHNNSHKNKDPHIWLSPRKMIQQVRTICDALSSIDPEHTKQYVKRRNDLIFKLRELYKDMQEIIVLPKNSYLMVFHPAWGYLADDFGLKMLAIEIEGKEPSPKALVESIQLAKEHNIKNLIVQKQFSTKSAFAIANHIGLKVVVLDPLAKDYFNNMREIARKLSS